MEWVLSKLCCAKRPRDTVRQLQKDVCDIVDKIAVNEFSDSAVEHALDRYERAANAFMWEHYPPPYIPTEQLDALRYWLTYTHGGPLPSMFDTNAKILVATARMRAEYRFMMHTSDILGNACEHAATILAMFQRDLCIVITEMLLASHPAPNLSILEGCLREMRARARTDETDLEQYRASLPMRDAAAVKQLVEIAVAYASPENYDGIRGVVPFNARVIAHCRARGAVVDADCTGVWWNPSSRERACARDTGFLVDDDGGNFQGNRQFSFTLPSAEIVPWTEEYCWQFFPALWMRYPVRLTARRPRLAPLCEALRVQFSTIYLQHLLR